MRRVHAQHTCSKQAQQQHHMHAAPCQHAAPALHHQEAHGWRLSLCCRCHCRCRARNDAELKQLGQRTLEMAWSYYGREAERIGQKQVWQGGATLLLCACAIVAWLEVAARGMLEAPRAEGVPVLIAALTWQYKGRWCRCDLRSDARQQAASCPCAQPAAQPQLPTPPAALPCRLGCSSSWARCPPSAACRPASSWRCWRSSGRTGPVRWAGGRGSDTAPGHLVALDCMLVIMAQQGRTSKHGWPVVPAALIAVPCSQPLTRAQPRRGARPQDHAGAGRRLCMASTAP